jgi:aminoglycoside phosphotransferase (APT) family kinase protein
MFNEEIRLAERQIQFDVNALAETVCRSVKRPRSDLGSISKLAEGGFNRILQVKFKDSYAVIVRIPYQSTVPKCRAVASEAATLDWLYSHGLPVPQVLGYSPTQTNPVGTEYLLLEKLEGVPLSDQLFTMDNKARVKVMRQIVDIEKRLMGLSVPASGSLYYQRDLEKSDSFIPIPDQTTKNQIVVGPSTRLEWWYRERSLLDVDRGPCEYYLSNFE